VIKLEDANIWISYKNDLVIGDAEGLDTSNFVLVMNQLKRIAKALGIRQIQFHASPGTSLHQLFSKAYKASPSFPVLFQDFGSSIPLEKIKFTIADIDIF
jgi:hypothetical protein